MKRILLTGDDGYNAVGTRILIAALKPNFDLYIVATKAQQSGVGGSLSIANGGNWGRSRVDGVPAIWFDGTPGDAIECLHSLYPRPFDLVISGINLGVNIGTAIISSGTFAAAYKAIALGIAPQAMAISWDGETHQYYRNHSGREAIRSFQDYPGLVMRKLVERAFAADFWGNQLFNINLPIKPSRKVYFTRFLLDVYGYWPPPVADPKTHKFCYPRGLPQRKVRDWQTDADIVARGEISLTPCTIDWVSEKSYRSVKNKPLWL